MTIAFDAFAAATGSGNYSWTHTPVGTPKAVIVHTSTGGVSDVTAVTYGGVAMTQMSVSPVNKTTGESGNVTGWFLGSGIPTGAQSVSVTGGANTRRGWSTTLTADSNTELVDVDGTINSDSQSNPSVTLSLGGRTCFCSIALRSGVDGGVGNVTPLTGWNSRDELSVSGTSVLAFYTYDTIGSADVTAGWTQAADDAQAIAIAVSEVDITRALTGQSATASAGTLAPASDKALSGSAATGATGTLAPGTSVAASGQAITPAAGTLAPALALAASGQAATATPGTVGPETAVGASGQASTTAAGTLVPGLTNALSGAASSAAAGALTPAIARVLAGAEIVVSLGTLTAPAAGDVTVALSGQGVAVSQGSLSVGARAPMGWYTPRERSERRGPAEATTRSRPAGERRRR